MEYKKPITENMKDKANKLFNYLKSIDRYATKEEIGQYLGISNERSVRDVISLLATRKPIISHSGGKGYRLAMTADDLEEVERTWAELSSRAEELERRMQPLIAFREKCLRY
jgi:biotin operon repressor